MALLAIAGVAFLWRVNRSLQESAANEAKVNQIPFTLAAVSSHTNSKFQFFSESADNKSAVLYQGDLYVCGRSSLRRYRTEGRLLQAWQVGRELPTAPLVQLAVRRGTGTPELWIATDGEGVLIYDGNSFRALRPVDVNLRKLTALLPLANGRMAVGTQSGIFVTDSKQIWPLHEQFRKLTVTALAGDEDGLWIGTRKDGVIYWHAGQAHRFVTELQDPEVLSLTTAGSRAWAGTPLGITEFSGGAFSRNLLAGTFAQALAVEGTAADGQRGSSDTNGETLVVSTLDEGLRLANLSASHLRPQQTAAPALDSRNPAVSFLSTASGLLAVTARSVVRVADGAELIAPFPSQLADSHVTALWADEAGALWVGYFDRGLDVLASGHATPEQSGGGVKAAQHWEDDVIFCVNRIKGEPGGRTVAVGTANGLALFDGSQRLGQVLDQKTGLIASHTTDVLFRRTSTGESSLVVATPAGLSFVQNGTISSLYAFEGLVNNHVYTVAERGDDLLAGTLGGFSLLRNGLVEASYTTANSGLRQNWITASATDGATTYLGTYGDGVVTLTPQNTLAPFETVEHRPERVEINPNALVVTSQGVYAGTSGQGLAVLRRGSQRWHSVREGLPSANVTALAERNSTLYIGTDNGLVTIQESALP